MYVYIIGYLESNAGATTIVITSTITLFLSATVTAIISSVRHVTTYMLTKRKYDNTSTPQDTNHKVLYEQVHSPSPSITKNDPQCQKNPAYDLGKAIVDTNPTYKTCK